MTKEQTTKKNRAWLWLLLSAAVILIDQMSKLLCDAYLKGGDSVVVIPHVFRFTYVENRGAAFGSLADQRWVFMIFSTVAIIGVIYYLLKFSGENRLLRAALGLIIGGGIGNMIDRVRLGYVIDFIDFYPFPKIWSWVFNVADSAVCIGAGLMILYCIRAFLQERKEEKEKAAAVTGAGGEKTDGEPKKAPDAASQDGEKDE